MLTQAIEEDAKHHVEQAVETAKADPLVSMEELTAHVYTDNDRHYKRGVLYEDSYIPPGQKY